MRGLGDAFINLGRYDIPIGNWGVPLPLIFTLVLAVLVHIFLTRTVWGYRIYALGGNETAAGLSGINTGRVKIMVYTLCALPDLRRRHPDDRPPGCRCAHRGLRATSWT